MGLNITAMDYRQYDNALGRFSSIDLLAEASVGLTPYHFGNNNPNYWTDPSGLRVNHNYQLNSGNALIDAMWNNTPYGTNSYWVNDGGGNFDYMGDGGGGSNPSLEGSWITSNGVFNTGFVSSVTNSSSGYSYVIMNGNRPAGLLDTVVLVKSSSSKAQNDGYDFSDIGNALGVGGLAYSLLENSVANKYWWMDANGNYRLTSILKKGANGKYIRGVQGLRNGYNSALKSASGYKIAGNIAGGLGLLVTGAQLYNNQITATEATIDAAFGVIGFFGPIGAGISATYFIGKLGYEYFSGETLFEKPQ